MRVRFLVGAEMERCVARRIYLRSRVASADGSRETLPVDRLANFFVGRVDNEFVHVLSERIAAKREKHPEANSRLAYVFDYFPVLGILVVDCQEIDSGGICDFG